MEIKDIIKFEPINLTHIAITFGVALIVIYAFKTQLNSFFDSLQDRPITVTMSGSETKIELDAPVKPELLAESISNPQGSEQDFRNWEHTVEDVNNIDQFQKLGFGDLYNNLSSLNDGDLAVINYTVDDHRKKYFQDKAMLKYLSVASQKIGYLAFYKNSNFVGMISIQDVISGLASKDYMFNNFGEKIKNGQWVNFPHLIGKDVSFEETPSVKELYNKLSETGLSEIPLLSNGKLLGLLNHKSISDELYAQVSES
jgi:hypothetical protein